MDGFLTIVGLIAFLVVAGFLVWKVGFGKSVMLIETDVPTEIDTGYPIQKSFRRKEIRDEAERRSQDAPRSQRP